MEEQKKTDVIRCETGARALMLKMARDTHKQIMAREKQKESQRFIGGKFCKARYTTGRCSDRWVTDVMHHVMHNICDALHDA